jgi:hypothetical protein
MSVTSRVFTGKPPASSTLQETSWALALLAHYFCIFDLSAASDERLLVVQDARKHERKIRNNLRASRKIKC